MVPGTLLKNVLHHDKEQIYLWDYMPIINKYKQEDIRVYYKPDEVLGSGVEIYVLEYVSMSSHEKWNPLAMEVKVIYYAICFFDGLRHLYMNPYEDKSEGYLNYADLSLHIKVYEAMQSLIEKYCRDWNA